MSLSLVQQHPSPLPKIGLSMSLSWVLRIFISHETYGIGMMHIGWVFAMLVLLADWIFVGLLLHVD
jgi:hypothetical protein